LIWAQRTLAKLKDADETGVDTKNLCLLFMLCRSIFSDEDTNRNRLIILRESTVEDVTPTAVHSIRGLQAYGPPGSSVTNAFLGRTDPLSEAGVIVGILPLAGFPLR